MMKPQLLTPSFQTDHLQVSKDGDEPLKDKFSHCQSWCIADQIDTR
jgi:hypothetical protein